jgi:hypothetical protein
MPEMIVVGIINTDLRGLTPTKATGPNVLSFIAGDNFLKFIETE